MANLGSPSRVRAHAPATAIGRTAELGIHFGGAGVECTVVKTLFRWLQIPEFAAAYRAARRDVFSRSIGQLQQAATAATVTMLKIMVDEIAPPACRVRAADTVLSHSLRSLEAVTIQALAFRVANISSGWPRMEV